jgi:pimeloyl-ACP methyl ester carboxylesterase
MRPVSYRSGSFELSVASDEMTELTPRYASMRLPVHILFGREDAVLDPALHGEQTAQEIPGARLVQMTGGHMLPVTHPAETTAFLLEAIAGNA